MTREFIVRAFFIACVTIIAAYVGLLIAAPEIAACVFLWVC